MRKLSRLMPVLFAPLLLSASEGPEKCPLPEVALVSPRLQQEAAFRDASARAEMLAPSAGVHAGNGRTRAVTPPARGANNLPVVNFIDARLFEAMAKQSVLPTDLAGDEEFLRRITLDLTGQIPDASQVTSFLADTRSDKRALKIDELLAADAFNDRWTMWFGDLVQNVQISTNSREYYIGRNAYYTFIRESFRTQKPYDQMVREVLSSDGDSWVDGPSNYWVRQLQPNGPIQDTYDNMASHSGEKFLGMPLLCLSCHGGLGHLELVNQSLRPKTRNDFWAMAAFFAQTRATPVRTVDPAFPNANVFKYTIAGNPQGQYLLNTNSGNKTPRTTTAGSPNSVSPAWIFTGEAPRPGESRRAAYGRILTADRQFARAAVNYFWKEMFGLAIVEPVNAFDLARLDPAKLPFGQTVQPTNPQLLEELTDAFISSGYNVRSLLRTMALSSSYQLKSSYTRGEWNESWTPLFARHYPRRLSAEAVLDAVTRSTGVAAQLPVQGIGNVTRAMLLPDPTEPGARTQFGIFLGEFGRGDRDDTPRTNEASITQALAMMNNSIVTTRVRRTTANSLVNRLIATTTDRARITDDLYLATLSRYPTAEEKTLAMNYLASGTLATKTEDLHFALMNQLEFLFY